MLQTPKRRRQILETAATLFAQRGYQETGIQNILDGSGVSRSLLYYHFPSKMALAQAVLERQAEAEARQVREPTLGNPALSYPDRLRAYLASTEPLESALPLLASEAMRPQRLLFQANREREVADCIRAGVAAGQFRPVNPAVAARMFMACVEGMTLPQSGRDARLFLSAAELLVALLSVGGSAPEQRHSPKPAPRRWKKTRPPNPR